MNNEVNAILSIKAAIEAGQAILEVYHSADFQVEKKDDKSPLTLADRRAHEVIMQHLSKFDIPILSEEGKNIPYDERKGWESFWLVDPLDGTKEFIKKNGEFTVNIAMISSNRPVAGIVFVPDKNILYFASQEFGSYRAELSQIADLVNDKLKALSLSAEFPDDEIPGFLSELISRSNSLPIDQSTNRPYTIAGSRSHSSSANRTTRSAHFRSSSGFPATCCV